MLRVLLIFPHKLKEKWILYAFSGWNSFQDGKATDFAMPLRIRMTVKLLEVQIEERDKT